MSGLVRRGAPEALRFDGLAAERFAPVVPIDGPPIVIVHGAMDRAAGFRRTIRHLPGRDVVAYDRRGSAGSIDVPPVATVGESADDLLSILNALVRVDGIRRLIVGHSAGGLIALHALAHPDVADLAVGAVVWEPPFAWNDWYTSRGRGLLDLDPGDAAESFLRSVIGDRLWQRMPESMRADRRAEGPALMADLVATRRADATPAFDRIGLPVLVGCGTTSSEHHRRSAAEAAAVVPGAVLTTIEGADHGVHLSAPRAFAELIASWPGR